MRKIMVLQHVGHEPLGTLNPALKAAGFRIRYVNFGRDPHSEPNLEGYRGLIVLGGPMGVYEAEAHPHLKVELKLIEAALRLDIPILGICLGSQLLAHVLGAKVYKAPRMEIGWCPVKVTAEGKEDTLFGHYESLERVFQLHQDTFEIPKSAKHLLYSDECAGQVYRYGAKAYGMQFHLEVDKPMIHRWLKIADNIQMLAASKGQYTHEQIVSDTETHFQRCSVLSAQTFAKFIDIFQLPERPVLLGSDHAKP